MQRHSTMNGRIQYLIQLFAGLVAVIVARFVAKSIPYARQGFFCEDDEIRYPSYEDTVNADVMNLTFVFIALLLVPTVELMLIGHLTHSRGHRLCPRPGDPLHPGLYSIIYFLLSLPCNQLAISTVCALCKRTISRLRPNFLAVCQPDLKTLCSGDDSHRYISEYHCFGEDTEDQYFSFPSGHSALSVGFATFIIYYLHKRCRFPQPTRAVLQLALALYALFVCLSRVRDHKHRLSDVAGGAVIGFSVTVFFLALEAFSSYILFDHFTSVQLYGVVHGFKHNRYITEQSVAPSRADSDEAVVVIEEFESRNGTVNGGHSMTARRVRDGVLPNGYGSV